MTTYRLERSQVIPLPLDEAFAFFSNPRNLERLTPDLLHFQFVKPPPEKIFPGLIIEYRLRLYGVPVNWRTRIETVAAPLQFVDVQDKGPYALWRHTHSFREVGTNRTETRDQVEFAMPLGLVGKVAYRLFVARSLEEIFAFRTVALERLFPG